MALRTPSGPLPASTEVNNARHEGAQLVEPVDLSAPADAPGSGANGGADGQSTLW